jgi:hypothetical protein
MFKRIKKPFERPPDPEETKVFAVYLVEPSPFDCCTTGMGLSPFAQMVSYQPPRSFFDFDRALNIFDESESQYRH